MVSMTLGKRIAIAREANGWTQADLASRIGVKPASVSRWESDDAVPRPYHLKEIANATNRLVDWFHGQGPPHPPVPPLQTVDPGLEFRIKALEHAAYPNLTEELGKLRKENAELRNAANLEVARLKKEAETLRTEKATIPQVFFDRWKGLSPGRQAICLHVLTGKRDPVAFLSDQILKIFESVLKSADKSTSQPPQ